MKEPTELPVLHDTDVVPTNNNNKEGKPRSLILGPFGRPGKEEGGEEVNMGLVLQKDELYKKSHKKSRVGGEGTGPRD